MATVTSELTRLSDVEGSVTLTSIGGGPGSSTEADVVIQAAQSAGRKEDNQVSDHGFWLEVSSQDVSASGVHVGAWLFHVHYAVITKLGVRFGSSTSNWEGHTFPLGEYPLTGGWVRAWVDVSRTPDDSAGTFSKTAMTHIAVINQIPDVAAVFANMFMDASDFTTGGLLLTGTAGVWQDFIDADEGSTTNKYGVVITKSGVIFCLARLTLASASSLVFNDSAFAVVFPDQALVASDFMGITADLQNASTNIDWVNGIMQSAGTVEGDLVVSGTSGAFDADVMTLQSLRIITLTSVCSLTNSVITSCGVITADDADLNGSSVLTSTVAANASAVIWDVATDPDTDMDSMTFSKGTNAHHAIEFGLNSPLTMTMRNMTETGFNASNGQNDSTFHVKRTTGTVTINVIGGTGNFSYRTDGATVNVVIDPVITLVNVKDNNAANLQNARVLLEASDGTGDFPFEESVTITRSGATATVSHTAHGLSDGDIVVIRGADQQEYNGPFTITNVSANAYDYTVSGSPVTPATGTITSSGAILNDLTDVNGDISDSRTFTQPQPIKGVARKSTASPRFKSFPLNGIISNITGLTINVQLIIDE